MNNLRDRSPGAGVVQRRIVAFGLIVAAAVGADASGDRPVRLLPPAWSEAVVDSPPGHGNPSTDGDWFSGLPLQPRNRIDGAPRLYDSWLGTAGLGLGLLGARAVFDGPDDASWHGPVLFDDWARDGLRADSAQRRDDASELSDVVAGSVLAWLVLDNTLTRGRDRQADAWRMTLNAFFTQGIVETTAKHVAGRERPDGSDNRSFYSGHAALTATGAGLICANHLGGDLYGNRTGDAWACTGAVSAALVAGSLRIAADKHYTSDVLVGWASGYVLGYLLPRRWYYREPIDGLALTVLPAVGRDEASVIVAMRW